MKVKQILEILHDIEPELEVFVDTRGAEDSYTESKGLLVLRGDSDLSSRVIIHADRVPESYKLCPKCGSAEVELTMGADNCIHGRCLSRTNKSKPRVQ